MKSIITEEILRRIGARLSRAINRNSKSEKQPLPKHTTSVKIVQVTETTQQNISLPDTQRDESPHRDTADFAFVGNHEPQFIHE